jgi:hypothetical protein
VSDAALTAATLTATIVRANLSEPYVARELGVTTEEVLAMCSGQLAVSPTVMSAVRMLAGERE